MIFVEKLMRLEERAASLTSLYCGGACCSHEMDTTALRAQCGCEPKPPEHVRLGVVYFPEDDDGVARYFDSHGTRVGQATADGFAKGLGSGRRFGLRTSDGRPHLGVSGWWAGGRSISGADFEGFSVADEAVQVGEETLPPGCRPPAAARARMLATASDFGAGSDDADASRDGTSLDGEATTERGAFFTLKRNAVDSEGAAAPGNYRNAMRPIPMEPSTGLCDEIAAGADASSEQETIWQPTTSAYSPTGTSITILSPPATLPPEEVFSSVLQTMPGPAAPLMTLDLPPEEGFASYLGDLVGYVSASVQAFGQNSTTSLPPPKPTSSPPDLEGMAATVQSSTLPSSVGQRGSLICVSCHEHPLVQCFGGVGEPPWRCCGDTIQCVMREQTVRSGGHAGSSLRWSCCKCSYDLCYGCSQHFRAEETRDGLWRCETPDSFPVSIRDSPQVIARRTDHILSPGEIFSVVQTVDGADGCRHLRLADGRGWVPEIVPAAGSGAGPWEGRSADPIVLCVRHLDESDRTRPVPSVFSSLPPEPPDEPLAPADPVLEDGVSALPNAHEGASVRLRSALRNGQPKLGASQGRQSSEPLRFLIECPPPSRAEVSADFQDFDAYADRSVDDQPGVAAAATPPLLLRGSGAYAAGIDSTLGSVDGPPVRLPTSSTYDPSSSELLGRPILRKAADSLQSGPASLRRVSIELPESSV